MRLVSAERPRLENYRCAGQGPKAFEIAEAEWRLQNRWRPGIDGETIVIPAKGDKVAVRYAWQADPKVNLVNEAGLPGHAIPHRSTAL